MRSLSTPTKLAVAGGLSAILLGTGAAAAWAQNNDEQKPQQQQQATELANKLGVTEDQLKQALEQLRESGKQDKPGDPAELDQKLADALGIDVNKVTEVMQEMHDKGAKGHGGPEGEGGPGNGGRGGARLDRDELSSRLDEAVSAGSLSSSDKDAVLKAFDAGVFGGGKEGTGKEGAEQEKKKEQKNGV